MNQKNYSIFKALEQYPNISVQEFESKFLEVPQECLILTMKANQKYFEMLLAWNNKLTTTSVEATIYVNWERTIVREFHEKYVPENVKGLLSMQKGKVIEMIVNDFKSLGYNVDYKLLKASDYGVPQNRERVVIIGNRLGLNNLFPEKTHADTYDLFTENIKPYFFRFIDWNSLDFLYFNS